MKMGFTEISVIESSDLNMCKVNEGVCLKCFTSMCIYVAMGWDVSQQDAN